MWPHVDKPAKTWLDLRPVVVTSVRMSVWKAVPAHRTPTWTPRLISVSPGEQVGLTSISQGGGHGLQGI